MIYLDNNATTPIDPRVLKAMLPYLKRFYGNPSSRSHPYGWNAEEAVDNAREQVAKLINANPNEIIFTSGATESNNMVFYTYRDKTVYISGIEHSSVYESSKHFCNCFPISNINDFIKLYDTLSSSLISVMLVNNEIGTIQPVKKLRDKYPQIPIHSDMAQALGKMKIDVKDLGVDYASFSAHKLYGPKGVGALYVKDEAEISRLIYGGGQEFGLRAGTLNVPGIVGFGKACEIAMEEDDESHVLKLSQILYHNLSKFIPNIIFHDFQPKIANNLHMAIPCKDMDLFMSELSKNVAISLGSACMSLENKPLRVLKAINLSEDEANRSIRIGIGRFNTKREMKLAAHYISKAIDFANNS
jgi:cysteine desulfurase